MSDADYKTFAFFESYFSNYIEGAEFELEEARRIVETGVVVPTRDADSHDILGTYAIASNRREMSRRAIRHPFARAVFILFVTSEVHPFADGNGRISRLMMNAELTAAGQAKIIVPTVFRPYYIGGLRRLSRDGRAEVLVAAMRRLWDYSRWLSSGDYETLKGRLDASNAFSDDSGLILRFN